MALEKILKNSSGVPTGEYERIAGGTLYADNPIGAIVPFGGTNIPAGFLLCNGSEVLKTDYAELYAVIGDAFGTASVNTKFVLPDLRGEFLRGAGTNSHTNQGNGGAVGEHQDSTEILGYYQNNTNAMQVFGNGETNIRRVDKMISSATSHSATYTGSSNSMGGSSYTIRPTNTSVNYIIKAKMVALPADLASEVAKAIAVNPVNIINDAFSTTEKVDSTDLSSYNYLMFYVGYSSTPTTLNTINIVESLVIPVKIFKQTRQFALTYSEGTSVTITPREVGLKYTATVNETSRRLVVWGY